MPKKPKKKTNPLLKILCVEILKAARHKMYSEAELASVRFLRFNRSLPCAACGKKVRIHLTMLCEFYAGDMKRSFMTLQWYPQKFAPLTPVCGDHPLRPAFAKTSNPPH